jgi:hypothetical protein
MSKDKKTKKSSTKPDLPKFEKPNIQNINKFKSNFRPSGRFQKINRSRR